MYNSKNIRWNFSRARPFHAQYYYYDAAFFKARIYTDAGGIVPTTAG